MTRDTVSLGRFRGQFRVDRDENEEPEDIHGARRAKVPLWQIGLGRLFLWTDERPGFTIDYLSFYDYACNRSDLGHDQYLPSQLVPARVGPVSENH